MATPPPCLIFTPLPFLLAGLQQAKDAEKDQYEVQLATIRTEMQEVKDQLTSENMVLGGKLASLEEFKVQKEDLMAKFAKLEKELESNKMEHKDVIYNLERKAVVDKDRLDILNCEACINRARQLPMFICWKIPPVIIVEDV